MLKHARWAVAAVARRYPPAIVAGGLLSHNYPRIHEAESLL